MTAFLWTVFLLYTLTTLAGIGSLGDPGTKIVTYTPAERAVRTVLGLAMSIWAGYLLFR